jgi:LysM repeat protein
MHLKALFTLTLALCAMHCVSAGAEQTYTVRKHDTLSKIATAHGVSVTHLADYNNLSNPDALPAGKTIKIPPSPEAPISYTVKKGENLAGIASRHGVTTTDIASLNHLAKPDLIKAGQSLQIPRRSGRTRPQAKLDPGLWRKLDGTRVKSGKWKYIIVHHSATAQGTLKGMDEYHRKQRHMQNGLAYHFVIGNGRGMSEGQVDIGDRWRRQIRGGHLASAAQNERAIGICLVGNFEIAPPSQAQMDALVALTSYLQKRCDIPKSRVKTHTQVNVRPTKCPGRHFPTSTFLGRL